MPIESPLRLPRTRPAGSKKSGRSGFTIIEILVVVAIIVILVAVVIAVGSSVKSAAQRQQTKVTLKLMVAVYNSYVQETGTVSTNTPGFVAIAIQVPQLQKSLNVLPSGVVSGSSVNDGFGNGVVMVTTWSVGLAYAAGDCVVYTDGYTYQANVIVPANTPADAPGNTTYWTKHVTQGAGKTPFFWSAGPDGSYWTTDDIFSFDP